MTKTLLNDILKNPIGIDVNSSILETIIKILQDRISRVLIFQDGKPIGVVSEKDILSYLFFEKKWNSVKKPIGEIMNSVFYKDKENSIFDAARFMIDERCSSIAVGSADKLDGIVTKTDLVKYYAENCRNYFKVSDHMSIHYFSVSEQDSIFEVVKTMLGFGISRMIIVDQDKNPIGIVSTGDIFKAFIKEGQFLIEQKDENSETEIWSKKGGMGVFPANKIMHRGIIKISYYKDLADAANMMIEQNINALGVEDENQQLVGVIGKRDIVLALRDDSIVSSKI